MKLFRTLFVLALGGPLPALLGGGCADTPVAAPIRALQSAGPVAFVCLGAPSAALEHSIDDCGRARVETPEDFSIPHLYALVTQPHTGEVAVIDLTTRSRPLVDQNPSIPGSNFLPVGAIPTDIVATPGGTATFVTSAETGFEAIYALPSELIRGSSARLTSWPSCALPATPGAMVLLLDPADAEGDVRPRCDEDYGAAEVDAGCEGQAHCHGDLVADALRAGRPGRYKLAVTLPDEGGVAIIDAQDILDQEAGARGPCPIDRWLPLDVSEAPPPAPPAPPAEACVPNEAESDPFAQAFTSRPAGLATDGNRLYVADRGAPLIHRLDLPTPCEPQFLPPLFATSVEEPSRDVRTSKVAVSPKTLDLEQFLYAIDDTDGSIMVFDVSDGAAERTPLHRPRPEQNPFQPPDRIRYHSPPREIVITQVLADQVVGETGSTIPVRCDPVTDGPGAAYRTTPSFNAGAGPTRLRGVFAFALLVSGDLVVIDLDDYDAPCRGPRDQSLARGCEEPLASDLHTSNEFSCRTVSPHEARSNSYLVTVEGVVNREPGVTALPVLFASDGTVLQLDEDNILAPRMRAWSPEAGYDLSLVVGSSRRDLQDDSGLLIVSGGADPTEHTLAMKLEDPRAHILSQNWTVVFEGGIPGFASRFAELVDLGGGDFQLREVTSAFCDRGVQPQQAIVDRLLAEGVTPSEAASRGAALADYVQIASEPPVVTDPYWGSQSACNFNACQQAYGTIDVPTTGRDFRIVEATQDTLTLVRRGSAPSQDVKCCFPAVVEFRVRTGNQWIVFGDQVGFLHAMAESEAGTCRPSCDPTRALRQGRVLEAPIDMAQPVAAGDPSAFENPFFRFAIYSGASERDMRFTFATQSSFVPLTRTMVTDNPDVQPVAARFLPQTGELVISDGSLEGLVLMDLAALAITRKYH
jgi:hypothetical protein